MNSIYNFLERLKCTRERTLRKKVTSTNMFCSSNQFYTELSEDELWVDSADDGCFVEACSCLDRVDEDDIIVP